MEISQKIIDYSIFYYLKYYPSKIKLKKKLLEKFGKDSKNGKLYGGIGISEIDYIIEDRLKNIIIEDEVIKSKIRVYKSKGKSKLYIKQKLYEREENKELVEVYLQEAFIDGEEENLLREYEKLNGKFDKNKIYQKLIRKGFSYDNIKKIVD